MYKLFGKSYPGKLCFDFGYNTQAILFTIKEAISWHDCYKDVIKTATDWSNWKGPTALWLDFCDFGSQEDLLVYALNPWGLQKETGDQSFLRMTMTNDYTGEPLTGTAQVMQRPSPGDENFYRDCFVFDDDYFTGSEWDLSFLPWNWATFFSGLINVFQVYLPQLPLTVVPPSEEYLNREEVVASHEFINTFLNKEEVIDDVSTEE